MLNITGANITVPYKEKGVPIHGHSFGRRSDYRCHQHGGLQGQGKLKGYNTNAIGFMDALAAAKFEVAGKRALVFGTGGAAKAVAFIFNWLQAEQVTIVGRDKDRNLGAGR